MDIFSLAVPENTPQNMPLGFPVTIFVSLRSGDLTGKSKLVIQGRQPDGKLSLRADVEIELGEKGPGSGPQVRVQMHLISPQSGLYWFDVLWNGELLTSIPAEIKINREPSQATSVKPLTS